MIKRVRPTDRRVFLILFGYNYQGMHGRKFQSHYQGWRRAERKKGGGLHGFSISHLRDFDFPYPRVR